LPAIHAPAGPPGRLHPAMNWPAMNWEEAYAPGDVRHPPVLKTLAHLCRLS